MVRIIIVSKPVTAPSAAFSSFRINTQREGLGDCLYHFRSRFCNIYTYVTSHVGHAHTMQRASQLIFVWLFMRAVDLL